jgi:hypothetical protein
MLNEQEQMKVLLHKILMSLNPNKTSLLLDQLEAFGRKSLPCMSEILKLSHNSDIARLTNLCISRVKQQFEWSDL